MGSANFVHIGTIKQAQLAAIRHNREVVARYRARAKTPGALKLTLQTFPNVVIDVNAPNAAGYQDSYEEFLQKSTEEIEGLQD